MTGSDKQEQIEPAKAGEIITKDDSYDTKENPSNGLKRRADSSEGSPEATTGPLSITDKVVVVESQDKPRLSAAAKGKGKAKAKAKKSFAGKYGKGKNDESDDQEDDSDDNEEDELDDDELDDDDPADLFTEEDMDFLKGVENPASRTRRKVIDFKKMDQELRREEGREDGEEDDDSEEEDGDYVPN